MSKATKKETKFTNPYEGCSVEEGTGYRIQSVISLEDFELIRGIRVVQGTTINTINLLWKALCNELRKRKITQLSDRAAFEELVANCRITNKE